MLALNLVIYRFSDLLSRPLEFNQAAPVGFLPLVKGAISLFGANEMALRLVPLAFGLATLVVASRLARHLFATSLGRLAFVAFFALSPTLIYYANELKQYGADVFWGLTLALVYRRHTQTRSARTDFPILLVTGILALFSSFTAVFIIAALGMVEVLRHFRDRRRLARMALAASIWGTFFLLLFVLFMRPAQDSDYLAGFWRPAFLPPHWLEFPAWFGASLTSLSHMAFLQTMPPGLNDTAAWSTPLNLTLTFLTGLCVLNTLRSRSAIFAVFSLALVLNLAASAFELYPFRTRPILYLLPFVFLPLATTLDQLFASQNTLSRLTKIVGVLIATCALLPPTVMAVRTFLHPTNFADLRELLGKLEDHRQPSEPLAVSHWSYPAYLYYRGSFDLAEAPFLLIPAEPNTERLRQQLSRIPSTWLIFSHRLNEIPPLLDSLAPHFQVSEQLEESGTVAVRLTPRVLDAP